MGAYKILVQKDTAPIWIQPIDINGNDGYIELTQKEPRSSAGNRVTIFLRKSAIDDFITELTALKNTAV